MGRKDIKRWIGYWRNAKMVAFDEIGSPDEMSLARKFCGCMRGGLFSDVTDGQLWLALQSFREDLSWAAHGRECESAALALLGERAR